MCQQHSVVSQKIKSALFIFLLGITLCSVAPVFAASKFNIGDQCVGTAVKVFDADTILFRCDTGAIALVRLAGIDAPESTKTNKACWQQPFGDTATLLARHYLLHKNLNLQITDRDKYHRWVGLLSDTNNNSANAWLVAQGLAHVYRYYPHPSEWETLEIHAQKTQLGLWHNPASCTFQPHSWRRMTEEKRCAQEVIFQQEKCQF